MAKTLTVRLDDETEDALSAIEAADPRVSSSELIREAIGNASSVVYFLERADGAVKIGYSASLFRRKATLEVEHGPLRLLAALPGGRRDELNAHERLAECRQGRTEWFVGPKVADMIQETIKEHGAPGEPRKPAGSATIIRWTPEEEALLNRVHSRFQRSPVVGALTRRDVIVAALRSIDGTIESKLRQIASDHGIVYEPSMTFTEFAHAIAVRDTERPPSP